MIREFAAAKINLDLRVGPLGEDGFHPLSSVVAFADIGDELFFQRDDHMHLQADGPFAFELPDAQNNLVIRAAQMLASDFKQNSPGAIICIRKNLPVASGIGGGSADAAATLRGLNRLWNGGLSTQELAIIGARLGSDVPACVYSQTLRMTGRGTRIEFGIDRAPFAAVLVNNKRNVSTGQVFARFDQLDNEIAASGSNNDLLPAAISVEPQISEVLAALREHPSCMSASLCGSGPTCFGRFDSVKKADDVRNLLAIKYPDWWVRAVTIG